MRNPIPLSLLRLRISRRLRGMKINLLSSDDYWRDRLNEQSIVITTTPLIWNTKIWRLMRVGDNGDRLGVISIEDRSISIMNIWDIELMRYRRLRIIRNTTIVDIKRWRLGVISNVIMNISIMNIGSTMTERKSTTIENY